MKPAICTVATRRTIALTRVLVASVRAQHPDVPIVVLLADAPESGFDPHLGDAEVRWLLDVDDDPRMRFRCGEAALVYAVTPLLLGHLQDDGFDRIVFLKQESLLCARLDEVFAALDDHPVSAAPHLVEPPRQGDGVERELEVLRSGVFNVGVLGVSGSAAARRFTAWWADRCRRRCVHDVDGGMHFEQRWLDLVPSFVPDVHVQRAAVANVGHWRLPDLRVDLVDGVPVVGDRRVVVLRFSGFDPERPDRLTRYHDRLDGWDLHGYAELAHRYAAALLDAGHEEAQRWRWGWDSFDDGEAVPAMARRILADLPDADGAAFGPDPFATGHGSFREWLVSPGPEAPDLGRFWLQVHCRRPDLQAAFPDPGWTDADAFRAWTRTSGAIEHGVGRSFLLPPRGEG